MYYFSQCFYYSHLLVSPHFRICVILSTYFLQLYKRYAGMLQDASLHFLYFQLLGHNFFCKVSLCEYKTLNAVVLFAEMTAHLFIPSF